MTEREVLATSAHLSMNLQVVARFLATTAHNHECRPVIKSLVIQKAKNSLRTFKMATTCEIFYPVGNILTPSSFAAVVTNDH
jgi:hypothetical protein